MTSCVNFWFKKQLQGGGKNVSLILIIKGQILNKKKPLKIKGLMPPSTCYQV